MSFRDEGISFSLEVNVEKAYEDLRKIETIIYRVAGIIKRMSGDENIDQAINGLQRLIAIANQARLAIAALQAARMAAGDPLAWATFGLSAATIVVSVVDMYTIEGG